MRRKKQYASRNEGYDFENEYFDEEALGIRSITDDDVMSELKDDAIKVAYSPFKNRAFEKILNGESILQFGDYGLAVERLRSAFLSLDVSINRDSLIFDNELHNAVIRFQEDHGLQLTGVVDRAFIALLDDKIETSGYVAPVQEVKENLHVRRGAALNVLEEEALTINDFEKYSKKSFDEIKVFKCGHLPDYCLKVSFVATEAIPVGDTVKGYTVYYKAVYGKSEEEAIKVANHWGAGNRITFANAIEKGTKVSVTIPLKKYLKNLFFDTPENSVAMKKLEYQILSRTASANEDKLNREEFNEFADANYRQLTENESYIALKERVKNITAPKMSSEGLALAEALLKDSQNDNVRDSFVKEFEDFGKKVALHMLDLNRSLLLSEAEKYGIWKGYGEANYNLEELIADIKIYKLQMQSIEASLPTIEERQRLFKEAYDAVGKDPYATNVHDAKVNEATGIEQQFEVRNELYKSHPIISMGDFFNHKGWDAEKGEQAVAWESFDSKSRPGIVNEIETGLIKQLEFISEAEKNIRDEDSDFVWDLGEIIPAALQFSGLNDNKEVVQLIQDKIRTEAKYEFIKNLFLIAGGIILTIVSLGEATPFLLAVIAAGGATGISAYYVNKDYHDYEFNQSMHNASMEFGQMLQSADSTMGWFYLSLFALLGDMVQVVRLLKGARATGTFYRTLISLSKQEGLTVAEMRTLERLVAVSDNFKLTFSQKDFVKIASLADKVGLSSSEMIDIMYFSVRMKNGITVEELLSNIRSWKRITKARGYINFKNKEAFDAYVQQANAILKQHGVGVNIHYLEAITNSAQNGKGGGLVLRGFEDDAFRALPEPSNSVQKALPASGDASQKLLPPKQQSGALVPSNLFKINPKKKGSIGVVSEKFAKEELAVGFINALERMGVKESKTIKYFVNYHNNNNYEFFNEVNSLMSKYPQLKKVDINALWGYTTNLFYKDLNYWLRENMHLERTSAMKKSLNLALSKLQTFDKSIIYRGIGRSGNPQVHLEKYSQGTEHTWEAFTSCGSSIEASFTAKSDVIFKIKHLDAKDISDFADGIKFRGYPRHELLIKAGAKFRVISNHKIDDKTGKPIIELIQIQ